MTNHKSGLTTVFVVAAIVSGLLYVTVNRKKKYATKIMQLGYYKSAFATIMTFEEPFLKEWYKAAKHKEEMFTFNGQKYLTKGGRAAK